MSLKFSVALAFLCTLLGVYAGFKMQPNPKQQEPPLAKQEQSQKCVAEFKKKKLPDGSVEDSFSFSASSSQNQEIKPPEPFKESGHVSGGGYVDSNFKYGASIGVSIKEAEFFGVKIKDLDLNADSDFNKDHRISAKKVLLRF